jgi:hypothetical protein
MPPKKGKNPEVFFDKEMRSLRDGDVYLDPIYTEKKLKEMIGGKPVSDKAFFPPKDAKHR